MTEAGTILGRFGHFCIVTGGFVSEYRYSDFDLAARKILRGFRYSDSALTIPYLDGRSGPEICAVGAGDSRDPADRRDRTGHLRHARGLSRRAAGSDRPS